MLRTHWKSAVPIVIAATIGIASAWAPLALGTGRLHVPPLPAADLSIRLPEPVITPTDLQARGITTLSGMNVVLASGALIASFCTLVLFAVTRATQRRTELLVHRAVGASQKRLARAALREGAAMALVGLVSGSALGLAFLEYASTTWPGGLDTPGWLLPTAIAAAVGATIVLGVLIPIQALRPMRPSVPPLTPLLAPAICAVQIAVCFAVLAEARQVQREGTALVAEGPQVRSQDTVLQLQIDASPAGRARQLAGLIERAGLTGLFDVASLSSPGALDGLGTVSLAIAECGACTQGTIATPLRPVAVSLRSVSADTFRALNTHVVAGRLLTNGDDWQAARVVVISQALARAHFQNGDAVGRRIQLGLGTSSEFTVVGVVEDQPAYGLGAALQPGYAVYPSVLQLAPSQVDLLVRPRGEFDRARILSWIPAATLGEMRSETERRAMRAAPVRWFGDALAVEALAVGVIALLGIGLSMAIWVGSMVLEFAVHRAVGARRRDVLRHIATRCAKVILAGLMLGILVAYVAAGPLSAIVPGVDSLEIMGLLEVSTLVLVVTALVTVLPAFRATKARPGELFAKYGE